MFKTLAIAGLIITGIFIVSGSPFYAERSNQKNVSPRELRVQKEVLEQVKEFQNFVRDTFYIEANNDNIDEKRLQKIFQKLPDGENCWVVWYLVLSASCYY